MRLSLMEGRQFLSSQTDCAQISQRKICCWDIRHIIDIIAQFIKRLELLLINICCIVSTGCQSCYLSTGGHNIREESLSVITLLCPVLTCVDFGFCSITHSMLSLLASRCPNIVAANFEGCDTVDSNWVRTLCLLQVGVSLVMRVV